MLINAFFFTDFYFANVKLFWPYDLYKFSEDLALTYLMRKNYDIELALALISKFGHVFMVKRLIIFI